MKIGAIMPVYDQSEWIERAINSIHHQVDQLIIVNDGSTEKVIRDYADINLAENRGTATAINTGYMALNKDIDWVTWVSADNEALPEWRELMCPLNEEDGFVYSGYIRRPPGKEVFTPYDPDKLVNQLDCYYGPSFVIRKTIWDEAGPHRGKISHDYDHWLRVEEVCWKHNLGITSINKSGVVYNVHPGRASVTRRHEFDAPHWQTEARKRRAASR